MGDDEASRLLSLVVALQELKNVVGAGFSLSPFDALIRREVNKDTC